MPAATFVPDDPCKRGHRLRYVSTGACVECRRATWRVFAAKNPDTSQAWKRRNPEKNREFNLAWHEKHPEVRAKARAKWLAANAEKAKEQNRRWFRDNPDAARAKSAKRRAAELRRTPPWLTDDEHWVMREAYDLAVQRTRLTGIPWDVDHIIPLQAKTVSGLHVPWNLRVIPAAENRSKGNRICLENVA